MRIGNHSSYLGKTILERPGTERGEKETEREGKKEH